MDTLALTSRRFSARSSHNPVSLVMFRAAAVDEQQYQGPTAFACMRVCVPGTRYAVRVANENAACRTPHTAGASSSPCLRRVNIDQGQLFLVGLWGGGGGEAPQWQHDIFGPQSLLRNWWDESMAGDNRRCQMPSESVSTVGTKPQGYLAGKGTRCVGSKVVNGFPHFNAKDDRSRGTPLRRLHLCRFTGLDAEFHDLCQHCETLGLCYLREPEEAGLASLS